MIVFHYDIAVYSPLYTCITTVMSGFGVTEESPLSERLYYNQVFYRSNHSHQQMTVDIHIVFTWNTEAHINVSYAFK